MDYSQYLKRTNNFPKDGVLFFDTTYLLKNVEARTEAVNTMKKFLEGKDIDKIVAIEANGFPLGSILAHELKKPLVFIRKPQFAPGERYSEKFIKEYGEGEYVLFKDLINPGEKVALLYSIMAGSGATGAAINLIKKCGGIVTDLLYVVELEYLKGREAFPDCNILSLVKVSEKNME